MKKNINILSLILLLVFASCANEQMAKQGSKFFDSDNMVLINGKRTFIIGSYHLPKTDDPYASLVRNGYNYVRTGSSADLDKAQKHGLYGWFYTGLVDEKDTVQGKKKLEEKVNAVKIHPALLFYEIADEPAFTWMSAKARISPERMKQAYDVIKDVDFKHAVITNHAPVNLISTMKKYNTSCDLVAFDIYPVVPHGIKPSFALWPDGQQGDLLNCYISQVGEYVDKMKKVVDNKRPVFAVLQGFAWEMLKPEAERDTSKVLYPTFHQERFMFYDAIVHGANGILIWGTSYTPQPSKFIDDLNRATRELADMQEVLSARTTKNNIKKEYIETGHSVDAGVEFITKEVGGKLYMISVNSDKNPVKVTFSGLDKYENATLLKEGRSIKIENGKFTETYKPFDVRVFEMTN